MHKTKFMYTEAPPSESHLLGEFSKYVDDEPVFLLDAFFESNFYQVEVPDDDGYVEQQAEWWERGGFMVFNSPQDVKEMERLVVWYE